MDNTPILNCVHLFGKIQHECRLFECPRLGAGLLAKDTYVLLEAPEDYVSTGSLNRSNEGFRAGSHNPQREVQEWDLGVSIHVKRPGLVLPEAVCGRGRNWVGRAHMSAQTRSRHREIEG